jgi:hypothetical protein
MLVIPPPKRKNIRPPREPKKPAVALTLVAATYSTGAWVRLTFDRAVDISAINVTTVFVNDDDSDEAYTGSGTATLVTAQQVQIPLAILHGSTGPGTKLSVSGNSGIVAVDDGGKWAGVSALALPFP